MIRNLYQNAITIIPLTTKIINHGMFFASKGTILHCSIKKTPKIYFVHKRLEIQPTKS